jgi:acyl-CoA reductase-like NAD-dependent aldehyde dehydrogenase
VSLKEEYSISALQVLSCSNAVAEMGLTSEHVSTVSFTGSGAVGFLIQSKAIGKRVLLELGGNAAVVVHSDADLKRAALRIAVGSNAYSGQSCIAVQRIYVHESKIDSFKNELIEEFKKIKSGDPLKPDTINGPLIDEASKTRILQSINEATSAGAKILIGGSANGNILEPTLIENVKTDSKLCSEEVFGPVCTLSTYQTIDEVIQKINQSQYGLHAGVFTDSNSIVQKMFRELECGGVVINEIPTFRADQLPYGGVKKSGLGREGVRYAMEEFSERKVLMQFKG